MYPPMRDVLREMREAAVDVARSGGLKVSVDSNVMSQPRNLTESQPTCTCSLSVHPVSPIRK